MHAQPPMYVSSHYCEGVCHSQPIAANGICSAPCLKYAVCLSVLQVAVWEKEFTALRPLLEKLQALYPAVSIQLKEPKPSRRAAVIKCARKGGTGPFSADEKPGSHFPESHKKDPCPEDKGRKVCINVNGAHPVKLNLKLPSSQETLIKARGRIEDVLCGRVLRFSRDEMQFMRSETMKEEIEKVCLTQGGDENVVITRSAKSSFIKMRAPEFFSNTCGLWPV
eukprot:1154601-Pelagomonas_calceolata.AAC.4